MVVKLFKRIRQALNSSGVSMVFVLAVMLLLMAIGVSALTAAGLNFGTHIHTRNRSQLDLYVSSMEHTVRDMLQTGGGADVEIAAAVNDRPLDVRLLQLIYNNNDTILAFSSKSPDSRAEYEFSVVLISRNIAESESIPSYGPPEPPDLPGLPGDDEDDFEPVFISRTPKTISVNADVYIEQKTTYRPFSGDEITVVTGTYYRLGNAFLTEGYYDTAGGVLTYPGIIFAEDDFAIYIKDPGKWTVTKHETVN